MRTRKDTAGISRIDQPSKRTYGFFVRLRRNGVTHNGFFPDKSCGGKLRALAEARAFYQKLLRKFRPMTRQKRAQLLRRKGSSGIVGVQKVVNKKGSHRTTYWKAIWSPKKYVMRSRMFSVRKYGARRAKLLAVKARKAGLRSMVE